MGQVGSRDSPRLAAVPDSVSGSSSLCLLVAKVGLGLWALPRGGQRMPSPHSPNTAV